MAGFGAICRRGLTAGIVVVATAGVQAAGASTASAAVSVTPDVAYQLNPAHTGASPDSFSTSSVTLWSRNLGGGGISYPLIVGGRVFVTVANAGSYGTELYALDAATGTTDWGPIALGGTYDWSGLTYGNGRVYTVNESGVMTAFNASSGRLVWSIQLPGQYEFSSPPTASGQLVFTGGAGVGGTVYAVRQSTGAVIWTAPVENGDNSSPAVGGLGVYVSYACGQTYDFVPWSGALIWHRATACEGGGGKTPVVAGGRLYVRDFSYPAVLSAFTGRVLGGFASSGPAPAVSSSELIDLQGTTLSAENPASGAVEWTFGQDDTLSSAPLIAGADVVEAGTDGKVFAFDAETGQQIWSGNAGQPVPAPDEQNLSQPLTGLGFSGGLLVVPTTATLVAFGLPSGVS